MSGSAAYLVAGAESSGTRMLTGLLVAAGCSGSAGHAQAWDAKAPHADEHPRVVWRRSVPHGGAWPELREMVERLRSRGYDDVRFVVTVRDRHCLASSQVAAGHVADAACASENIRRCYRHIFSQLAEMPEAPYVIAPYESLVLHGAKAAGRLLEALGLDAPDDMPPFRDENAKYFGGDS